MVIASAGVIPQFTVGDRLRKARELTGLDQAAFGEEIGVSRQSVGNYELEHTPPRKIVLRAWSMRTGVPVAWLEHGIIPEEALPRVDSNHQPADVSNEYQSEQDQILAFRKIITRPRVAAR